MGGEKAQWVGENWRVEDPASSKEMLLSPFPELSIALSLLIRKLMQLSVLILESSFYSFFFFFFLLHNLFLFRSALICAVAADDKTGHIRLLSVLFTSFV